MEAAKSALSASRQQLEVSQADQQHYAALSEYSRITAPFDGVVTWRYADTGSLIQAGTSNVSSHASGEAFASECIAAANSSARVLWRASVRDGEPADIRVKATDRALVRKSNSVDRLARPLHPHHASRGGCA